MTNWTVEQWPLRDQPDRLLAELHAATEPLHAEAMPGDPRRPLADEIAALRHLPAPEDGVQIIARDAAGAIAGFATCDWEQVPGWDHVLSARISVLPAVRRRGLGRQLAGRSAGVARDRGLRLIMSRSWANVPAGAAFARQLGAEAAMVVRESRQDLSALDPELVRSWVAAGPARAPGYRLLSVTGRTPPELAGRVAGVLSVMNTAPRDSMDVGDMVITPELVCQYEEAAAGAGEQLWACYAEEAATGRLVGLTNLSFRPGEPDRAHVGDTGVEVAHRGRGLGRWLKAAMTARLLAERPGVRWVITHNAGSNAAMLGINHQLGFRPAAEITTWQIATGNLQAALAAGPVSSFP